MLQDIKDDVLAGEPLYVIEGSDGTILQDNVKITQKTPVVEEATELNRATLANLQGDLYTQDRYNKLQVNLTDTGEVKTQTYNLLSNMISKSTASCENEYVRVASSSVYSFSSSSTALLNAFDGNAGTSYQSGSKPYNIVDLIFKKPIKLTKIKLYANSSGTLGRISIKGSIDGTQYIELYSSATYPSADDEIILQNTNFYKYYCLEVLFSGTSTGYFYLNNFEVTEWIGSLFTETCELNIPLSSYEENKILNVELNVNKITEEKYQIVEEFTSNVIPVFSRSYAETSYGIWECSSTIVSSGVFRIFDGDNSTSWGGIGPSDTVGFSIGSVARPASKSKFAIKPKKIIIRSCGHDATVLMGRRTKDGVSVELGNIPEVKNAVITETVIVINTEDYFDLFYVDMSGYSSAFKAYVYSFEITEGTLVEGILEEQIQKEHENLKLNINKLGVRTIAGIIRSGEKCSLIYNGENWHIKNLVVTGTFTQTDNLQQILLGFEPDLVIVYHSYNNSASVAGHENQTAYAISVPRILTKAYKGSYGYISSEGFYYDGYSSAGTAQYIAIKF